VARGLIFTCGSAVLNIDRNLRTVLPKPGSLYVWLDLQTSFFIDKYITVIALGPKEPDNINQIRSTLLISNLAI
jgi:hypothetical protein